MICVIFTSPYPSALVDLHPAFRGSDGKTLCRSRIPSRCATEVRDTIPIAKRVQKVVSAEDHPGGH